MAILKCRVCGNSYEGCRHAFSNNGVFRWQAVACSPECGEIYLKNILASRGETKDDKVASEEDDLVLYDYEDEDDFDDEDDEDEEE